MPVYNNELYIGMAIDSVLRQSYKNFELIIVNDGSIDGTESIIKKYFDTNIRYFKQENQGVSKARNVGLLNMKGDYFCFLDADDILCEKSLEYRLDIFKNDTCIEFVDGRVDYFREDPSIKIKSWTPSFQGNPLEDLLKLTGKSFFGNTWMIKRKSGLKYKFKEGLSHCEDLLFYINLARKGGLYSYTNQKVLKYRIGHQSSMRNLKSLESGYLDIYKEICLMNDIPHSTKKIYYRNARNIMCKSYLGNWQPINGLRAYFRNLTD
jgi:glycosyltransferase involved in cell wall biosynthesis